MKSVHIIHAGVGEGIVRGRMMKVIRGTLTPQYLSESAGVVLIPEYQRMAMLNGDKHEELRAVLAPDGLGVPDDLLVCIRTQDFRSVGAGEILIEVSDGLYLLDGHQRVAAARARLKAKQKVQPLGVKVLVGTTDDEEKALFYQVNRLQTKVSSDVHLRNSGVNPTIKALRELAETTEGFPTVRWDQLKIPGEDLRAHTLYEVTIMLHGFSAGKTIDDLLTALEDVAKKHGTALVAQNVKVFFQVLEKIFGVRVDEKRKDRNELARYMYRADLLRGLAKLFSRYELFWDRKSPNRLAVSATEINKLRGVKVRNLERDLAVSGATNAVFHLLFGQLRALRDKPLDERSW